MASTSSGYIIIACVFLIVVVTYCYGQHNDVTLERDTRQARKTITVSSILNTPYMMEAEDNETRSITGGYMGYCMDLMGMIAHRLNMDFRVVLTPDGKYGSMDKDGKWDGMIGEIINNRADVACADLTMTATRNRFVDYTKPFMHVGLSLLYQAPKYYIPGLDFPLVPFTWEVWVCLLAAWIASSFIFCLVSVISPYERENQAVLRDRDQTGLKDSFWHIFAAFIPRGGHNYTRAISVRMVLSVWWWFFLVILIIYTAKIVRLLNMEPLIKPASSAKELLLDDTIDIGVVKGGSTYAFLKDTTLPLGQDMWSRVKRKEMNTFNSVDEGIQQVKNRDGKFAALLESKSIEYVVGRDCSLRKVPGSINTKPYSIASKKGSELTSKMSAVILALQDEGLLDNFYYKWWEKDKVPCEPPVSSTDKIGLMPVGGLFIVLAAFLVIALVISFVELCLHKPSD